MKHTFVCSPVALVKKCTEHSGCLVPSERRMNWTLGWSSVPQWVTCPSDHPAALSARPFDQIPWIGSQPRNSVWPTGLEASPQRTHVSRWMIGDMEMGNRRISRCWKVYTLFLFLSFFAHYFHPSPWFRWYNICIGICAIYKWVPLFKSTKPKSLSRNLLVLRYSK